MNRLFLFCAALLLQVVLFSCKEEADTTDTAGNAVGFSISPISRVAELTESGLKASGFRVSAYSTGADGWATAKDDPNTTPGFMYDQPVTWSTGNNAWEYSPVKYWPKEADGVSLGKVSFFAWSANAGATPSANTEAGAPELTVTVPNTQADQRDLVAGVAVDETSETVTSTGGVVPFEFSHILSRIGFKAVKEQGQGETVITSLKVRYAPYAVKSTGVYTFGDTDHDAGGWTLPASGNTYMSNAVVAGDEVVTTSVTVSGEATADAVRVNGDDRYLMLLPQEVKAGAVLLDVSWTVGGGAAKTYTVSLPRQVWSPGKCHDYNLIVGQTGIALGAVAVNPWDGESLYKTTYTITYDANGGTGAGVVRQVVTNVAYPLDKNTFTSPSADAPFDGWNTAADGSGEDYREGDSFMSASDAPVTLYAQWAGLIDLSTEKAPAGVTYSNPVFTINSNGKYAVINSTTSKRIVVASGKEVIVTLSDASIDVSGTAGACAFDMAEATVTLKLRGDNVLKSGTAKAGVRVPNGASLTINGFSGGALTATGGNGVNLNIGGGAGIGGNGMNVAGETGGNITINSGIVTATGGGYSDGGSGAGIGGGGGYRYSNPSAGYAGGAGGTVTINGGIVTATSSIGGNGGGGGAGIGGGGGGDGTGANPGGAGGAGGTVTITGGTITATGGSGNKGADFNTGGGGAGIGGGGCGDNSTTLGAAATYTGPGAGDSAITGTSYDSGSGDPRVIATAGSNGDVKYGQAIGTGGAGER